jgi:hypothetical protein
MYVRSACMPRTPATARQATGFCQRLIGVSTTAQSPQQGATARHRLQGLVPGVWQRRRWWDADHAASPADHRYVRDRCALLVHPHTPCRWCWPDRRRQKPQHLEATHCVCTSALQTRLSRIIRLALVLFAGRSSSGEPCVRVPYDLLLCAKGELQLTHSRTSLRYCATGPSPRTWCHRSTTSSRLPVCRTSPSSTRNMVIAPGGHMRVCTAL